jgi:hypothetical protein
VARAFSEYLEGVRHVGEAGVRSDLMRPRLDLWPFDLDRIATRSAHQMVMVLLRLARARRPTKAVRRLAVRPDNNVDDAAFGKPLEVAIDRRQTDRLTLVTQLVVQRLRRTEAISGREDPVDRGPLPGRPSGA